MFINENRMAPLYHTTSFDNAAKILSTNVFDAASMHAFNGVQKYGVCLTRDKYFAKTFVEGKPSVIFVLDQDLLKQNYKVKPYDYFQYHPVLKRRSIADKTAEAEEFVIGPIKDADKYIISVLINEREWENYQEVAENSVQNEHWKRQARKNIFVLGFYQKLELTEE